MDLKIGDNVVYPNHGVAVIERIDERQIGDQSWPCYHLRLVASSALVVVPLQNARTVGLRRTIKKKDVTDVLDRLRNEADGTSNNWKGRFKENSDRMRTGLLPDVADVLKSLSKLASTRSLSFREKLMLEKARELVVTEIAAVQKVEAGAASVLVDQALGRSDA